MATCSPPVVFVFLFQYAGLSERNRIVHSPGSGRASFFAAGASAHASGTADKTSRPATRMARDMGSTPGSGTKQWLLCRKILSDTFRGLSNDRPAQAKPV